jgi:hypothetical protein
MNHSTVAADLPLHERVATLEADNKSRGKQFDRMEKKIDGLIIAALFLLVKAFLLHG